VRIRGLSLMISPAIGVENNPDPPAAGLTNSTDCPQT
jgi:hypothetical protein